MRHEVDRATLAAGLAIVGPSIEELPARLAPDQADYGYWMAPVTTVVLCFPAEPGPPGPDGTRPEAKR